MIKLLDEVACFFGHLGSRVVKRPKLEDGRRLQEAAIRLLEQHQNLGTLLREVGVSGPTQDIGS